MYSVIRVVLQLCKTYYGRKATPSKKDIAVVISCLEKEGELSSPRVILDHNKWDSLTFSLCERAMNEQKDAEFKTWGLVLGALKAARKGKTRLGAALGIGSGGFFSCRCEDLKDKDKVAGAIPTAPITPAEQQADGPVQQHSTHSTSLSLDQEKPSSEAPYRYPKQPVSSALLRPSLGVGKGSEQGREDGSFPRDGMGCGCGSAPGGGVDKTNQDGSQSASAGAEAEAFLVIITLPQEGGLLVRLYLGGGRGENKGDQVSDWSKIREAFLFIVNWGSGQGAPGSSGASEAETSPADERATAARVGVG